MPELPIDLNLYGIALVPFVLALVMLAQDIGLSDYWADWLRAGLVAALSLLVLNQAAIAELLPWFPVVVTQVLTVLGIFLTMKGFWPSLRSLWNRTAFGSEPTSASTLARVAQGERKTRFW